MLVGLKLFVAPSGKGLAKTLVLRTPVPLIVKLLKGVFDVAEWLIRPVPMVRVVPLPMVNEPPPAPSSGRRSLDPTMVRLPELIVMAAAVTVVEAVPVWPGSRADSNRRFVVP